MTYFRILILLSILVVSLLSRVKNTAHAAPKMTGSHITSLRKKATVVVKETKLENFSDLLLYPARVRSKINTWIVSETSGEIKKILKPIGSPVKKGDLVFIIQNSDPIYHYAPVQIKSPINGFITQMGVDLLMHVEKGQKLFSITDPHQLVIDVEIPAADLKLFSINQLAQLKINDEYYDTKIQALSPIVDVHTGTARSELVIMNSTPTNRFPNRRFPNQGEVGQVIFKTNERSSFVIPENAIIYRQGKTFVRILDDLKVKRIPVTISQNLGDKIEIKEGLLENQKLITQWSRFISDNEEVDIEKAESDQLHQSTIE